MNILIIFPPVATPVSPYLAPPLLAGQLESFGFNTHILDLSLEFFDYILGKNFLLEQYNKAKAISNSLKILSNKKTIFSHKKKLDIIKEKIIDNCISEENKILEIINNIEDIKKSYKNPDIFYDINKIDKIALKIKQALHIAMLPFLPEKLSLNKYSNPLYKNTFKDIQKQVEANEENIFDIFYKRKLSEYHFENYELICLSVPNETMIFPSVALAKHIKEKYNKKIVIGGNIISRIDKELAKQPQLFKKYWDYAIVGTGENSIVQLAKYIENKDSSENLSKIKGLIYLKNNKLVFNKPDFEYDMKNSSIMSLKGINLSKYYTPDIIMPIQISKGCYWGKCLFCGLHYPPKKYTIMPVEKVVDEIEYLKNNFNIKFFEFVDEAIFPEYLSDFADELLKRNLNIKYCLCSRIEENYTDKLCKKLFNSGLRLVQFGYETESKHIYDNINKGIDYYSRKKIIKMFADANIWTYCYAIIGYPDETEKDALSTLNVYKNNKDIIDTMFIHEFWLDKKAPILRSQNNSIKKVFFKEKNSLSQSLNFISQDKNNQKEIKNLCKLNIEENPLKEHFGFSPDEYFFLYVMHYGKEYFKNLLYSKN